MKARKLRVLRIDDRTRGEKPVIPTAAAQEVDAPPEPIELVSFAGPNARRFQSITGWRTALQFWLHVKVEDQPDLVAADVLFEEDESTPLNWEAPDRRVPTGLSHLKPFAAVSRIAGRPLGLGIHTANPRIWSGLYTSAVTQRMGAFAAHEIGELAAILGDDELVAQIERQLESDRAAVLEACWSWLERRTAPQFDRALKLAVLDYRRLLAMRTSARTGDARLRTFVMPADWVRLMKWCDDMRANPQRLRGHDIPVPFLGSNDAADTIWLSSLFGDVDHILDVVLPATCFETVAASAGLSAPPAPPAWALDTTGNPQIGGFLEALGSLGRAYQEAVTAVGSFMVRPMKKGDVPNNLRAVVGDTGHGPLVRGLVVLFQWVRREFGNHVLWQEAYQQNDWNRQELRFGRGTGTTLEEWLRLLQNVVRGRKEWFDRADAFDDATWDPAGDPKLNADSAWVCWHFDRLVDLEVLEYDEVRKRYRWRRSSSDIPRAPAHLPAGENWVGPDPKSYIRDALGFGAAFGPAGDNPHAIGQTMEAAFELENEEEGRQFLERFIAGHAPRWLVEVCREYARSSLEWTDKRTWPLCLRAD